MRFWIATFRGASALSLAGFLILTSSISPAQIQFKTVDREVVEGRLKGFADKNDQREAALKQMFVQSGCQGDHLSEQIVKGKLPPNVTCVLPGETDSVILVGAHFDKVSAGDGVVDNWSGASLLPSFLSSLSGQPRHHTFVFVGFTAEEDGMVGSEFYARKLTPEQRSKIVAMVNMDTLGLGPTEVWASHSDKLLQEVIIRVASAMKLPVSAVNVDNVGSTDSESFAKFQIPRITIHTVTTETWPILHTNKDKLAAIKMDDYYTTYQLLAAYLAFLDTYLAQPGISSIKAHR